METRSERGGEQDVVIDRVCHQDIAIDRVHVLFGFSVHIRLIVRDRAIYVNMYKINESMTFKQ